jgi:hypothetical protein
VFTWQLFLFKLVDDMRHVRITIVTGLLSLLVIVFSRCNQRSLVNDERGELYAGAAACKTCHKNVFESYIHSYHYNTSSLVNADSVERLVSDNDNPEGFIYADSGRVSVQKKDGSFFQTLYVIGKEMRSVRMDIAFGSGEKAQTYAYWKDGHLLQLPLTFFRQQAWVNSPGFPVSHARFDRVIIGRCFECHSSFIHKENVQAGGLRVTEKLDSSSIIYGIDCERCHGPAAAHVKFHSDNPSSKESKFIASIKNLTRQQQLDLCGVCHSGNDFTAQRSLFAFVPGDTLANFLYPEFGGTSNEPDVHGKQMQLLQQSRCFQQSQMTCGTCHSPHSSGNDRHVSIDKCMSCHTNSSHAQQKLAIYKNHVTDDSTPGDCFSCHMPLQRSKAINFASDGKNYLLDYKLRTHRIAVY